MKNKTLIALMLIAGFLGLARIQASIFLTNPTPRPILVKTAALEPVVRPQVKHSLGALPRIKMAERIEAEFRILEQIRSQA